MSPSLSPSRPQRKIYTIQEYIKMDNKERREMVSSLSDVQYEETLTVANGIPFVDVEPIAEVVGEDRIYTNSLITIKATLTRMNWLDVCVGGWMGLLLIGCLVCGWVDGSIVHRLFSLRMCEWVGGWVWVFVCCIIFD